MPLGFADRRQLPVGEIARMRAQGVGVGMRGDQRRVAELGDVPEALFVEMRKVDQDLQPVAGANQLLAEIGQARPGVGRRRTAKRHAVPERVRPAPHRAERAQPGLMQHIEGLELRVDRLRAFDMQNGGQHAGCRCNGGCPRRCGRCGPARPPRVRCGSGWTPCSTRRFARSRDRAAAARARRRRCRAPAAPSLPRAGLVPGEGTKIANMPPAKPPCRAIGRSSCPLPSPSRNARGASGPLRFHRRSSASLCPSKIGTGRDEFIGRSPSSTMEPMGEAADLVKKAVAP